MEPGLRKLGLALTPPFGCWTKEEAQLVVEGLATKLVEFATAALELPAALVFCVDGGGGAGTNRSRVPLGLDRA